MTTVKDISAPGRETEKLKFRNFHTSFKLRRLSEKFASAMSDELWSEFSECRKICALRQDECEKKEM